MLVDLKLTEKSFNKLLDYINYLLCNIAAILDKSSDVEILEAHIDIYKLKRDIAQYIPDYESRKAFLTKIDDDLKTCYELLDEERIKVDLIERGLKITDDDNEIGLDDDVPTKKDTKKKLVG